MNTYHHYLLTKLTLVIVTLVSPQISWSLDRGTRPYPQFLPDEKPKKAGRVKWNWKHAMEMGY